MMETSGVMQDVKGGINQTQLERVIVQVMMREIT